MADQQATKEKGEETAAPFRIDVKLHDVLMEAPRRGEVQVGARRPGVDPSRAGLPAKDIRGDPTRPNTSS